MPPRNSRFTDYPFRLPGLTKKQVEWLEQRNRAIKIYRETSDSGLAEEIGLFWNKNDENRARAAQKLRFSDNPFTPATLTKKQKAERYGPIIAQRQKRTIKGMLGLFKPIGTPYKVYRGMKGPLLKSDGREAQNDDELWIDGFMSASRSPQFAAECAAEKYGDASIFIEILPTPQAETITLANEVNGLREYESIFNVGQKVRIEKVVTGHIGDFHPLNKMAAYFVATLAPAIPSY